MSSADSAVRGESLSEWKVRHPAVAVHELCRSFGGLQAVQNLTFDVETGEITGLIGPNGAGKSTAANLMAGAIPPDAGRILLDGTNVTRWPSHKMAQAGLIRTFQLGREFAGLTVLENVLVGARGHIGESLLKVFLNPRAVRAKERSLLPRAVEMLKLYGLYRLRDSDARELSGGQKRLLELARAEMAEPRVLLLDEPMSGVNPALIDVIAAHILDMKSRGVTVLIIEHNMEIVERICDSVVVMVQGRMLIRGQMSEVRQHPEVISAYLGEVKP